MYLLEREEGGGATISSRKEKTAECACVSDMYKRTVFAQREPQRPAAWRVREGRGCAAYRPRSQGRASCSSRREGRYQSTTRAPLLSSRRRRRRRRSGPRDLLYSAALLNSSHHCPPFRDHRRRHQRHRHEWQCRRRATPTVRACTPSREGTPRRSAAGA